MIVTMEEEQKSEFKKLKEEIKHNIMIQNIIQQTLRNNGKKKCQI